MVESGRLGQRRVGPHADGQDHELRRIGLAGTGLHLDGAAVQLLEAHHAVVGDHFHAMADDMLLDEHRDLRVQRGQDVIGLLDEGHVEAGVDQVFRCFQTDETAADHDGAPHRLDHLDAGVVEHARQKGRAAFDPLTDRPRIGHGTHMKDPGQIDAGQGRMDRRRAGRQHELVVALGGDFAGFDIAQLDGLLFRGDPNRFAVGAHFDGEMLAEQLLAGHQQARFLFDDAADMVGQPAVGVRHIRPALHHEYFRGFIQPAQARGARRAAGHAADDDDL